MTSKKRQPNCPLSKGLKYLIKEAFGEDFIATHRYGKQLSGSSPQVPLSKLQKDDVDAMRRKCYILNRLKICKNYNLILFYSPGFIGGYGIKWGIECGSIKKFTAAGVFNSLSTDLRSLR